MSKWNTYRKWLMGFLVLTVLLAGGLISLPAQAAPAPSIVVNGTRVDSDVPPIIQNSRTLVPIRFISNALGAEVKWVQAEQTAYVMLGNNTLAFPYNQPVYYINGLAKPIDVNIQLVNNRIMIPLRAAGESLGQEVGWDNASRTVIINTPAGEAKTPAETSSSEVKGIVTVVQAPGLIFKEASTDSAVVAQAKKDVRYDAVGKSGEFYQIILPDGQKAWISKVLVKYEAYTSPAPGTSGTPSTPNPAPTPAPPANPTVPGNGNGSSTASGDLEVTASVVNIRSGPSTSHQIIGTVKKGDRMTRLNQTSDWYNVRLANGQTGWIFGLLVQPVANGSVAESAPATEQANASSGSAALTVKRSTPGFGQHEVTFKVNDANVQVLANKGNKLSVAINGLAFNGNLGNPVAGKTAFVDFKCVPNGNKGLIIHTSTEPGGYFRLDRRGDEFSIMAVKKHKNGQLGLAGKTIVVSAGHGEYTGPGKVDPGAIGSVLRLSEVAFNTPVAIKLKRQLEAAGAKVIMIREYKPVHISLAQRAMVANDNNADAYVEIHGDAAPGNPNALGIGVYYFDGNIRLTSAAQKDMRAEFASAMQKGMEGATGTRTYTRKANYAVLRENEVPSVLIECGFLTTPSDEKRLATDAYQTKLAQGMYDGLVKYFSY
ncbi:N-acetylmuramoyl-L-alanine amidase [Peptococcus niger]|uniref:N-acetylmuramoyl-L-alanine amidase n=1 Tax=Peptococcus niger TaxID=2741 RepID=A0A1G6Z902_PEPNI|nr:N-acetylmuramoyl-L-alanine amidase [Peptococcus niger]SDD98477.1 N-acetylmuramoyl-L-alanine amidase [Peptococcus niger]